MSDWWLGLPDRPPTGVLLIVERGEEAVWQSVLKVLNTKRMVSFVAVVLNSVQGRWRLGGDHSAAGAGAVHVTDASNASIM